MQIQRILILTCSLTILFLPRAGPAGVRPSWIEDTIFTLDRELFQTLSTPNKWGYIIRIPPDLSDNGLTFSLRVGVSLRGIKTKSYDEAEALFCELYPDILDKLNSLRTIRPLLASFPLDPDSCPLDVMFVDDKGWAVFPPFLAGVSIQRNALEFFKRGAATEYKTVATREAQGISSLKKLYQPKCPRARAPFPRKGFQFLRDCWRHDNPFSREKIRKLEELCYKTNLTITAVGIVGKNFFDSRPIEFALCGSQQLTIESARKLATSCLQHVIAYLQESKMYEEFLKNWTSSPHCHHVSSTPSSDQIAFRINFWDENIDRPVAPYIAEIRLLDDKLSYFTADENQCLVLTFEETV